MYPGCVIRRPVERNRFKTETTIKIQNKKTPLTTNTFLVRFQGPQDARAAIREKQAEIEASMASFNEAPSYSKHIPV